MKEYSVFDILGPIMIGPSSSHTAGAARLSKIAAIIAGKGIKRVKFFLHGSFSKTYKGHGTDKALVAGILGMDPWDENLKYSFEIANKKNIEFEFIECDLGDVHPNTVKFLITTDNENITEVIGSSIGGGNITIIEVNEKPVEFTGDYPTIIINHKDIPGMISKVSTVIYEEKINIAFLKVYRSIRGSAATMVLETDSKIEEETVEKIKSIKNIQSVRIINPI